MSSLITGIEFLSRTRTIYHDELSFANKGLKLNTIEDVRETYNSIVAAKRLPVLRLEGNTISPEAAIELSEALKNRPELERFIGNDIFTGRKKDEIPPALRSICGAFEHAGAHLVEINLSDNAFGPIGLDALVSFFQSSTCYTLQEIRMHNNGLGPEGAKKLALAIEQCYYNSDGKFNLKIFICGRNRLEYEGCKAVSNTLKVCGTLEEIQMPQNGIRPNGIQFIAEALSKNPRLKIINLNDNTFRKIGAEQVAKAVASLTHLEYVNFGDCLTKSKGAYQIVKALEKNYQLKELILSGNEINAHTGLEIAHLLIKYRKNSSHKLSLIDLNSNNFGMECVDELKALLKPMYSQSLCSLSDDEGSECDEEEEIDEDDLDNDDTDDQEEVNEEDNESCESEEYEIEQETRNLNLEYSGSTSNADIQLFQLIDSFIQFPSIEKLNEMDFENVDEKFWTFLQPSTLVYLLNGLSRIQDESTEIVLRFTCNLLSKYFLLQTNCTSFASALLVSFGVLKSEDKRSRPLRRDDLTRKFFKYIFDQNLVPLVVKTNLVNYLKLRYNTSNLEIIFSTQ